MILPIKLLKKNVFGKPQEEEPVFVGKKKIFLK